MNLKPRMNTTVSKGKFNIPIVDRKITDPVQYSIYKSTYLNMVSNLKNLNKLYKDTLKPYDLDVIGFLLMWAMFSDKTISANKCEKLGICDKKYAYKRMEALIEGKLCLKMKITDKCYNFTLTNLGIDCFLKIFPKINIGELAEKQVMTQV